LLEGLRKNNYSIDFHKIRRKSDETRKKRLNSGSNPHHVASGLGVERVRWGKHLYSAVSTHTSDTSRSMSGGYNSIPNVCFTGRRFSSRPKTSAAYMRR